MTEELTTEGTGAEPGASEGGPSGVTATANAPQPSEGQSAAADPTTTPQGSEGDATETFFDPASIQDKPELMAAYKQMQRDYGSKMEDIKAQREKIAAYDAFSTDPLTTLQAYAKQLGYTLNRGEPTATPNGETPAGADPQTWDDVYRIAEERVLKKLEPVLGRVGEVYKSNTERMLDEAAPDWRMYEDKMTENLQKHPTLANDPVTLYRLSVPPDVLESRATQAALAKLQTKAESSRTSGVSTTTKTGSGAPTKPLSFDEAVAFAKRELADKGIMPGA